MSRVIDALRRHQRTGRTPGGRTQANHPTRVLDTLCPRVAGSTTRPRRRGARKPFFDWHVALIAPIVIIFGTLIWMLLGE